MATSFNLPANPANGQEVALPSGIKVMWNGSAWVFSGTAVVFPIAIDKGGTNATTAAAARTNLGLANHEQLSVDAATGNLGVPGAVNFCGKQTNAFYASYFNNSPLINFAANAFLQWDIANTRFTFNTPAGGRQVIIDNQCNLSTQGNVTGANLITGGSLNVTGTGNIGNGLTVANGLTVTSASIQAKDGAGIAFGPADYYAVRTGGGRLLQFAPGYYLRWEEANGRLQYVANSANGFTVDYQGNLYAQGNVACAAGQCVMNGNHVTVTAFGLSGSNYFSNCIEGSPQGMYQCLSLQHTPGVSAGMQLQVGGSNFTFNSNGNAQAPGSWQPSDASLKSNIEAVTETVLDKLMAVPVKEYDRLDATEVDGTPVHQVGWVAQDVAAQFPKITGMLPRSRAYLGPVDDENPFGKQMVETLEPVMGIHNEGMVAVLWKAVQELTAQKAALEGTVADLMDRVLVLEGAA